MKFKELFENGPRVLDRKTDNGSTEWGFRHADGREEWGLDRYKAFDLHYKATRKGTNPYKGKPFVSANPRERPHNK